MPLREGVNRSSTIWPAVHRKGITRYSIQAELADRILE